MKSKSDSADEPEPVKCLNCGYVGLPTDRNTCASCDDWIDQPKYASAYRQRQDAPGCLRIYAILLGIGALIGGLSAFMVLEVSFFLFIITLGMAVAQGFVAAGLFDMKKWGRNLGIAVLGISLIFDILSFSVIAIFGIIIRGYVLIWLLNNGHLFTD